jgi:hypothetical protein
MNKIIVLVTIIMFISLSVVSADDVEYYAPDEIGDYELVDEHDSYPRNFHTIHVLKYENQEEDSIVYVQLIYFEEDVTVYDLDYWITNHVENSNNIFEFDDDLIYVEDSNQVFWRNGDMYIKIQEKQIGPSSGDPMGALAEGNNNFEESIILEFLEEYPSECNKYGCVPMAIEDFKKMYPFEEPEDLFQLTNSYGVLLTWCPADAIFSSIKEKLDMLEGAIRTDITDEEINVMVEECEEKDSFTIDGRPITEEIRECFNYVISLIDLPDEDVLQECEMRKYFNERFNEDTVEDYDQELFDSLFEERDRELVNGELYGPSSRNMGEPYGDEGPIPEPDHEEENVQSVKKDSNDLANEDSSADEVTSSSEEFIEDVNEEISILTVTTSVQSGPADVVRYIDTKETILKKSVIEDDISVKEVGATEEVGFFKRVFGFLPWF